MKISVGKQLFLAVVMPVWVAVMTGTPTMANVQVGQAAPEIRAKVWLNVRGNVSLAALRGKIVVVEFWATWCPPCRDSIPHLNELHKKWASKGVVIVGLTDEHRAKVSQFMKKLPMHYIVGTGSKDGGRYGVNGIPHAFVVDPEGRVVWRGHPMGGLDQAIEEAYQNAPPKLKKKKSRK